MFREPLERNIVHKEMPSSYIYTATVVAMYREV